MIERAMKVCSRRVLAGVLLLSVLVTLPALGEAKERAKRKREPVGDKPLLIFNIASVERVLNQAVFAFEEGGRPELAETLGVGLAKINDLKGFNRQRSVGMLVYFSGLVPEYIAYFPVKNIDEMLKTVEIGPISTKKVGENLYEIASGKRTWHVLVNGEYAFVADSREMLERDFGDPAAFSAKIANQYDIGAMINLNGLSSTARDIFVGAFRAKAESDLQRRDNEPVAAHRLRRAVGMQRLDFLEQLVSQGEHVMIGLRMSQEEKTASFEVQVAAKPGSDFALSLNELKGTRTQFANLLGGRPPLTVAASLKLDKSNRKVWQEIVTASEAQLLERLGVAADDAGEAGQSVREFFRCFRGPIDAGHLDAVSQFIGQSPGPYTLVGAAKVSDGTLAASSLRRVLTQLQKAKDAPEVQFAAVVHRGIEFHRVQLPKNEERLYGGKPGLYVGAGESAVWFAVGCDGAADQLKKALDKANEKTGDPVPAVAFQFAANLSDWFEIMDPKKRNTLARQAMTESKDTLRVDVQGLSDGARLRVRFDEGFIRLVGLGMIKAAERWQSQQEAAANTKPAEKAPENNSK